MKKIMFALLALVATTASAQQYMRLWSGGDYKQVMLAEAESMPVADGATMAVAGATYSLAALDSITFGARVHVRYSGTQATVDIPAQVRGVTARVSGADVTIDNALVGDELEFVLSGTSQTGSFTYNGTYKTTIILNGLNLKSGSTSAINIQCGKRIDLKLADGTANMLEDCAGGQQKAALYCKGHIELAGAGTLTVTGNTGHAIATKEYFILKKSVQKLRVAGAVKDGMHIGQYYQQNGSIVEVACGGDAIQVEAVTLADGTTPDPSKELNGQCIIKGGSITATAKADDTVGLKADGDITISGGTLTLTATGAGSRCIKTSANMLVNEDSGATQLTLAASGEKFYDSTGDSSRCRLGKVGGDLTFDAGNMAGTFASPAKGFKIDGTFTWNRSAGATYSGMGWEAGKITIK